MFTSVLTQLSPYVWVCVGLFLLIRTPVLWASAPTQIQYDLIFADHTCKDPFQIRCCIRRFGVGMDFEGLCTVQDIMERWRMLAAFFSWVPKGETEAQGD